jgi:hypothetical protein
VGSVQRPIAQRFAKYVRKGDGCWEWTGAKPNGRYGTLHLGGPVRRTGLAHRISWMIHFGPIPDGLCVLHRCDNPGCVRPDHLFLGTKGDNNRDAVAKNRHRSVARERPELMLRGERHPAARLTERDVIAIRLSSCGPHELATTYAVTYQNIMAILTRKTWRHV